MAFLASELLVRVTGDTAGAEHALRRLDQSVLSFTSNADSNLKRVGGALTGFVTLPLLAVGAAAATTAFKWEDSWQKIRGLTGLATKEIGFMQEAVKQLAIKTGQDPMQLADAFYFVASNGGTAAQALDIVSKAATASAIGMGKASDVAHTIIGVINAYGTEHLNAARAIDILVEAEKRGNQPAGALANVLSIVTPIAAQLGVKFQDVAAALSVQTSRGISASRSATGLRAILSDLLKPSAAGAKALHAVGLSTVEIWQSIHSRGLLPTLDMLRDKFGNNTSKLRDLFKNIFGFNAFLSIVRGNTKQTADTFHDVANSNGALNDSFKKVSEQGVFKFHQAWSEMKVALIDAGGPILRALEPIVKLIGTLADKFQKLNPHTQQFIVYIGMAVAAIGPLLLILNAILDPIGLVILGIAAIGIAFATNFGGIRDKLQGLWDDTEKWRKSIVNIGSDLTHTHRVFNSVDFNRALGQPDKSGVGKSIASGMANAGAGFDEFMDTIKKHARDWKSLWNGITGTVKPAVDTIRSLLQVLADVFRIAMSIIRQLWERMGSHLLSSLTQQLHGIIQMVRGVLEILKGVFDIIDGILTGKWSKVWKGITEIFGGAWHVVMGSLGTFVGALRGVWAEICGVISLLWHEAWLAVKKAFAVIWSGITTAADAAWGALKKAWNATVGFFKRVWDDAWGGIKRAASDVWGWLKTGFKDALDFISGIWDTVWGGISTAASTVWQGIQTVLDAGWTVIKTMFKVGLAILIGPFKLAFQIIDKICHQIFDHVINVHFLLMWNRIKTIFNDILQVAKIVWGMIRDAIVTAVGYVVGIVETYIDGLKIVWDRTWHFIYTIAMTVWDAIYKFVSTYIGLVVGVVERVINGFKVIWDTVWGAIKTTVSTIWNEIYGIVSAVVKKIIDWATAAWNGFKDFWVRVWDGFKNVVSTAWQFISDTVSREIQGIKNIIDMVTSAIKTTWDTVWNGLKDVIHTAFDAVWAAVSTGLNGLIGFVEGALNSIIDIANKAIDAINKASLGLFTIHHIPNVTFPRVPGPPSASHSQAGGPGAVGAHRFAEGGLVTAGARGMFAFFERQQPEIVVPLSKAGSTFSAGGGVTVHKGALQINVQGSVDESVIPVIDSALSKFAVKIARELENA